MLGAPAWGMAKPADCRGDGQAAMQLRHPCGHACCRSFSAHARQIGAVLNSMVRANMCFPSLVPALLGCQHCGWAQPLGLTASAVPPYQLQVDIGCKQAHTSCSWLACGYLWVRAATRRGTVNVTAASNMSCGDAAREKALQCFQRGRQACG